MHLLDKYVIGDNLSILDEIEDGTVDLVYLDPPFFTNRNFGDFDDKWKDINEYCYVFMRPRIDKVYKKLKNTANFVLHCDVNGVHYLKVMLDSIFGFKNFRNEIIWQTSSHIKTKKKLQRSHDTLLVYGKTSTSKYNPIYRPYDDVYHEKNNVKFCTYHNQSYVSCAIHNSQPDVIPRPNLRYEWCGHYKQWLVSKEKMQKLHDENRLIYSASGIPRIKRFLNEMPGVPLKDVWIDINSVQAGEKIDYATQKPVKLLERIVLLYTDVNDVVLDCFAGSGSVGRACLRLNRHYILIDKNLKGKEQFDKSIESLILFK